jgi:hypothetical protein
MRLSFCLIEMVSQFTGEDDFPSCSVPLLFQTCLQFSAKFAGGLGRTGRDNTPILPLEWLSGKMKELATFTPYASIKRHQPILGSSWELCALPARISD